MVDLLFIFIASVRKDKFAFYGDEGTKTMRVGCPRKVKRPTRAKTTKETSTPLSLVGKA